MKNHVAYKLQGEEVNALYANALVANISVIITVILFLLMAKVSGLGQAAAIIWALSMIAVAVLRLLLYRLRLVAPDKYSFSHFTIQRANEWKGISKPSTFKYHDQRIYVFLSFVFFQYQ